MAPQLAEQLAALPVINGTAIIRIDEAEVPELGSLVEVGHSGRADLDRELCERVVNAVARHALRSARGNRAGR